ncbi:Nuclear RNA export factor 2 [Strongyloides ratti]|uniref:Nuclear RNA export factor 2 n=1 Tax=Strongyloides ratti TaxID=34506 RepID=A0A090LC58_STRRB|nr:Nuclear RNA export factor 2 [Strongyloides ratti]CEF67381.1 Nuclear RNA export factor 2 [Strongyloides ratti]
MLSSKIPEKYRKRLEHAASLYFKNWDIFKDSSETNVYMNRIYKYKGFLKDTESYYIKICNVSDLDILNILREYCDFIPLSTGFLPPNTITFWVITYNEANSLTQLSRRINQNGVAIHIVSEVGKYRIWNNLTEDDIKAIKDVCSLRYSAENNSLDLTSFLHEDVFNTDDSPGITLEKIDVTLTIAKFILSECPNIERISFSSNNLHSFDCLEPILHVAKKLHTIDVSFNYIKNVSCFNVLKRFRLKEIYVKEFQSDKFFYLDEKSASSHISSILQTTCEGNDYENNKVVFNPKLNFDNFSDFSTHFQYEEHFMATDPIRISFFNNIPKLEQAIKTFTQSYIFTFDDNDIEGRRKLKKFYRSKSTFSLCITAIRDGRGHQYYYGKEQMKHPKNSEFLSKTHNMCKPEYYQDKLNEVLFVGNEKIINAFLTLPLSQHDMSTFVYDVTYTDVNIILFTVKGLVNFGASRSEHSSKWIHDDVQLFTRSFACTIQKNSVIKIISEIMTIYPSTKSGLEWYRKSLTLLEPPTTDIRLLGKIELQKRKNKQNINDDVLVERLCFVTNMIPSYSLRCLMDSGYDFAKSIKSFEAVKDLIPKEGFDRKYQLSPLGENLIW